MRISLCVALISITAAPAAQPEKLPPLQIQEQASFLVGGKTITNPGKFDPYKPTPEGQSFSGDHAYVFYQVPVKARKYPLILWHGFGQFSKTWETTPDGREGYQNIFLRRRFSVYVIDQPRRGDAGRSMVEATIKPTPDEQNWFGAFRIGIWPNYFPGVQFSRDPEALNQYFRQMTPNIGPFDLEVVTDAGAELLEKTGPAHSRDAFTRRRAGLGHGHQESERPRHRGVRTGEQLCVPGRRSPSVAAELERCS